MSSDDSDDEPLSVWSRDKKENPDKYRNDASELSIEQVQKRINDSCMIESSLSVVLDRRPRNVTLAVTERPEDVWMCITDLNNAGPFSCLLCPQWFINRTKIMLHYAIEHKKDYCGICRYYVEDRHAWAKHLEVHVSWPCPQCPEIFKTLEDQQVHLTVEHSLVHCRLCHIQLPDNEDYNKHLSIKHHITKIVNKHEVPWVFDTECEDQFDCLYCCNDNLKLTFSSFFNHYINYHQFTMKCISFYICGVDLPFVIPGVNLTQSFIDTHLRNYPYYGYASNKISKITGISDPLYPTDIVKKEVTNNDNVMQTDIKIENDDTSNDEIKNDHQFRDDISDETKTNSDHKINNHDSKINESQNDKVDDESHLTSYKGEMDFDITLVELVVLFKCFYNYVEQVLNDDVEDHVIPASSEIDYSVVAPRYTTIIDIVCNLCNLKSQTLDEFVLHLRYKHYVRYEFMYSCRACKSTFNNGTELENHIFKESAEFNDLWLCQFCDREFEGREELRQHLLSHREELKSENCFSPHIGFKCCYCPILFWNEIDRESHLIDAHMEKYTDQYYKCQMCPEVFSDKVWYVHHHLKVHKAEDPCYYMLKCTICSLVMPSLVEIKKHFSDEHPGARKYYCCLGSCVYRPFATSRSLRMHVMHKHRISRKGRNGGPVSKLQCTVCRCMLETLDEKKLHYILAHPYHRGLECGVCGAAFSHKSALHAHRQIHANALSVCKQCGKSFTKREAYREHIRIHQAPRYACSYCPRRFITHSNLTRHERRHTGEKPFPCPFCPLMFSDRGAATSHAKTHSTEAVRFTCTYCSQTFTNKTKLNYHTRKHTGENLEPCPQCDKVFTCGSALREHMKIHGDKAAVDCPLCDRTYTNKSTMMKHVRAYHADATRVCPLCPRAFSQLTSLRLHVGTHTTIKQFRCKICPKSYTERRGVMRHLRLRHPLQKFDKKLGNFYRRLDPWDLDIKLDEENMISIFGPRKASNDADTDEECRMEIARLKTTQKRVQDEESSDDSTSKPKPKRRKKIVKTNTKRQKKKTKHKAAQVKAKKVKKDTTKQPDEPLHYEIEVKPNIGELDKQTAPEIVPTDYVYVKIEPTDYDSDNE